MNLHPVLGLIAAFFAFHQSAHATSFVIQKFSTFVNESPFIVRGNLRNIYAENGITSDGQKTIHTYATLEIKEVLKGSYTGSTVQVRKIGGTIDGFTLEVPSSPEFHEGEDTVLFLGQPQEDKSYEVLALELGKFELEPTGDDYKLKGGLLGYTMLSKDPKEKPSPEYIENSKPWTLSQLRELTKGDRTTGKEPQDDAATLPVVHGRDGQDVEHNVRDSVLAARTPLGEQHNSGGDGTIIQLALAVAIAIGIFFFFKKRG